MKIIISRDEFQNWSMKTHFITYIFFPRSEGLHPSVQLGAGCQLATDMSPKEARSIQYNKKKEEKKRKKRNRKKERERQKVDETRHDRLIDRKEKKEERQKEKLSCSITAR